MPRPGRNPKRQQIKKKVEGTDARLRLTKDTMTAEQEAAEIKVIRERGGVPTIKEKHVKKGKLPKW